MFSAKQVFDTLTNDEKEFVLKAIREVGKEAMRQRMEQPNFVEDMRRIRAKVAKEYPPGFMKGLCSD